MNTYITIQQVQEAFVLLEITDQSNGYIYTTIQQAKEPRFRLEITYQSNGYISYHLTGHRNSFFF